MAGVTNRAQQIFSSIVPAWLVPKTTASKATAIVAVALVSVAALVWVISRSLRGRASKGKIDPKNTPTTDTGTKVDPNTTSTKNDKVEPKATDTSNSSVDAQKKAQKKIIYVCTDQTSQIYVTWEKTLRGKGGLASLLKPMTQVGVSNRWEIEVAPEESHNLEFYIFGDSSNTSHNLQIKYGIYDLKPIESAGTTTSTITTTPPVVDTETIASLNVLDAPDNKDADVEKKPEPTPAPSISTPPTSPSKLIKAKLNVGYHNTLLVNGVRMENDGSDDGWVATLEAPTELTENELSFSINDSSHPVSGKIPVSIEDQKAPTTL